MPVPSQGHYGFHSFPVVDWFCLFMFWLSLCKIVRSSVILLLPLFEADLTWGRFDWKSIGLFWIKHHCLWCLQATQKRYIYLIYYQAVFCFFAFHYAVFRFVSCGCVAFRYRFGLSTNTCFGTRINPPS